ncbi:MAG: TusE/DsrC/DsvC family sulfur relay protein [Anaerolineae bacterium]|jgi:tRNA 2-thiouridine synthesizing protein E|nr:TusE/DsrC/DsvC family sulfur relay protein [Anaerolineae bacterium]MBT4460165.1 TusE/DsrC/DsvC family sulfur relay protein [Anaerolineae bacterium]MBT4843175.1 TusE/DsrC/DsvC family sulfur relay protein [Anaerolineae bacterium]MBT6061910.1 TusE/DsrC/DsvC family sulfur relay protein [Anaerolineae bacterium]MBT6323310.1 TusE/DsrC/DsvC family sulfur relay protein [Anaerolineae bacterium]
MTALDNITLNDEGFMTDPTQWTEELAPALAEKEGITLTDAHWIVINFSRETAVDSGAAPTLRQITKGAGVTTKDLFKLFPKGPAKKVAKISGLGKPEGCV